MGSKSRLGIKSFTCLFFLTLLLLRMGGMVHAGSLRMMERQFGLTATDTGLFYTVENIMALCMILILGYLGDNYNIPRMLGICSLVAGVSYILPALPYFLNMKVSGTNQNLTVITNITTGGPPDIVCHLGQLNTTGCQIEDEDDVISNRQAYYIIVISRLLLGLGFNSQPNLGAAYIVGNTKQQSMHIGTNHYVYILNNSYYTNYKS